MLFRRCALNKDTRGAEKGHARLSGRILVACLITASACVFVGRVAALSPVFGLSRTPCFGEPLVEFGSLRICPSFLLIGRRPWQVGVTVLRGLQEDKKIKIKKDRRWYLLGGDLCQRCNLWAATSSPCDKMP